MLKSAILRRRRGSGAATPNDAVFEACNVIDEEKLAEARDDVRFPKDGI